jgi:hypothetical protein
MSSYHKTNVTWAAVIAIFAVISFFGGRYSAFLSGDEVANLDAFTKEMKPLIEKDDARSKEHLTVSISVLRLLDRGSQGEAKNALIEQLGRYYYNYTYENERYMNTEITESLLKTMQRLSAEHPSFRDVIKFKPKE